MKSERMAREDLCFDASLGAYQHNFMSFIAGDPSQREGRHQVSSCASARYQDLHVRRCACGVEMEVPTDKRPVISTPHAARFTPHVNLSGLFQHSPTRRWRPAQRSGTIAHTT